MITNEATFALLQDLLKSYTLQEIASSVGVNMGTAKRWLELGDMPKQYYIELCRFANIEIDYSNLSEVDKDQFFTAHDTSKYCFNKTLEVMQQYGYNTDEYTYLEPSAGDGSFYNIFPEDRRIGVDIEPKCEGVVEGDFLLWEPPTNTKIVTIGNPPFGFRGNLALKFLNKAGECSDFVAFIVPQMFSSDGKGSCKGRVKGLNLIHNEIVSSEFYYPNGKTTQVNVVFQIWAKHESVSVDKPNLDGLVDIYSISDGGTPGTTRNKKYHDICDYFIQSTCFGKDKMLLVNSINELPQRKGYGFILTNKDERIRSSIESISWGDVAFVSTNGAVNLRKDLIEAAIWEKLPADLKDQPVGLEAFFG